MNETRVINFALWGYAPKYLYGFRRNVELAREFYPDWSVNVYTYDIPEHWKTWIRHDYKNVQFFDYMISWKSCYGLYLRFQGLERRNVDRIIVRDADSRINAREADAVQEWVESGKGFHCMRDHKAHRKPIMGGMWGMKRGACPEFYDLMKDWVETCKHKKHKRGRYFKTDQRFLAKKIWPLVKDKAMVHDDAKRITGDERPFRVKLPDGQFVGQQFDADDKAILI